MTIQLFEPNDDVSDTTKSDDDQIAAALAPAVSALLSHPIYAAVSTLPRLRQFMREHVFAVWDFMTLLKRLQLEFCGTVLPWTPPSQPRLARFINEIVLAEESDVDGRGGFTSHFDLYLSAMDQIAADTRPVRQLIQKLSQDRHALASLDEIAINPQTKEFVRFNLELAERGAPWEVAAAFCYGREDIIPAMFTRLLRPLMEQNIESGRFRYYLERHVELDGDEHGPLARHMVTLLVGEDDARRRAAIAAGRQAIDMRVRLWDGILESLE
ncbi:DUF3050 domain-containing protein [Planctomicrobium piriforme]|uniref:DUF3050 domain-containing protein n=1 Tax=Planctomicrobium piriforme TaxID=1576369 RepID=A0A1I3FCB4_9PLAN|nr:DUF3050 domain-containing protein [Planctomicrobium piriforme]SFI08876.1 Protein of unknown function [Planctomicrobium piriforme]